MKHVIVTIFVTAFLLGGSKADDPEFPPLRDYFENGHQIKGELTETKANKSAYFQEYYSHKNGRGRIDLLIDGHPISYYYELASKNFVQIFEKENMCKVYNLEEHRFTRVSEFYGWIYHNTGEKIIILGPSAILAKMKYDSDDKPKYVNTTMVRGIPVNLFSTTKDNVKYQIFATVNGWKDALNKDKPQILRLRATGKDVKDEDGVKIPDFDINYEFTFIRNYEEVQPDFYQIPFGIGCVGMELSLHQRTFPDTVSFVTEILNYTRAEQELNNTIYYVKMTQASSANLTRLDVFSDKDLNAYDIYDHNSGVTYHFEEGIQCSTAPLNYDSMVEKGSFAFFVLYFFRYEKASYLGQRTMRGIPCEVWEVIEIDSKDGKDIYDKIVFTYFIASKDWINVEDDVQESNTIVKVILSGYAKEKDGAHKLLSRIDVNVFDYREDITDDADLMFNVEKCYAHPRQRQYYLISFPGDLEASIMAERVSATFKANLKATLIQMLNLMPLRVPYINVDYEEKHIYAEVLLLERPSVKGVKGLVPQESLENVSKILKQQVNAGTLMVGFTSDENDEVTLTADGIWETNPLSIIRKRNMKIK